MTSPRPTVSTRTLTEWRGIAWLIAFACAGVALALLYPDSYQQDGGTHFLFARDSWWNHELFLDVWGRPLFTTLYAIPARLGYLPAKLFSVAVSVATAWQCWRWTENEGLARAELAIPLFALQPSVLLLASDTMTEPLFALVLVISLRLWRAGRVRESLVVASLLPLARPEGFFVCALWGIWLMADARLRKDWWQRARWLPLLMAGVMVWWLAALLIMHDPLFILHKWPPNWAPIGAVSGTASWLEYWHVRYEIIFRCFAPFFAIGFVALVARRQLGTATSLVGMIFVLHSVLRHFGLFGSVGYVNPRYFVCVAPAIALITLAGWNLVADALCGLLHRVGPSTRASLRWLGYAAATALFFIAARSGLYFIDDHDTARDASAVADANAWLRSNPTPVRLLVWSQTYMCIIQQCETRNRIWLSNDRARNLALLRAAPSGTLVFWDGETGPNWYTLRAPDFEAAGFSKLLDRHYVLAARFARRYWYPDPWTRSQEMMLYYKGDRSPASPVPAAPH